MHGPLGLQHVVVHPKQNNIKAICGLTMSLSAPFPMSSNDAKLDERSGFGQLESPSPEPYADCPHMKVVLSVKCNMHQDEEVQSFASD